MCNGLVYSGRSLESMDFAVDLARHTKDVHHVTLVPECSSAPSRAVFWLKNTASRTLPKSSNATAVASRSTCTRTQQKRGRLFLYLIRWCYLERVGSAGGGEDISRGMRV
jgi:hypothetical protein